MFTGCKIYMKKNVGLISIIIWMVGLVQKVCLDPGKYCFEVKDDGKLSNSSFVYFTKNLINALFPNYIVLVQERLRQKYYAP